ncbi:MAG: Asp-tRNA(Asn)/Glu-tRNA(Gln) amidotransferase subunit GatC [Acidimicrobiia bacterium]
MTQRITQTDVEHVAQLARLALTAEEVQRYTAQLEAILEHADELAAIDTAGVTPTAHPVPLLNVLRPDVVRPGAERAEVLAAAPAVEDGRFRVPRILGEAQ